MDKLSFPEAQTPQIQVESWSNSARILQVRGFTRDGTLSHDHTTSADRSRTSTIFDVSDIPAMLQVSPAAGPVRRGECYVRVTLLMAGFAVGRLIAGYVTDGATLAWPGGVMENFTDGAGLPKFITGTNPAAGIEISEIVPTNARWKLRSLTALFATDATVANRTVTLFIDDQTVAVTVVPDLKNQAASTTHRYSWGENAPDRAGTGDPTNISFRLPNIILFQGYRFRTSTGLLTAGDDWGVPIFEVEEWIEE